MTRRKKYTLRAKCSMCKKRRLLKFFLASKHRRNGVESVCINCSKSKKWRLRRLVIERRSQERNREKRRLVSIRYRKMHPDRAKKSVNKSLKKYPEKENARKIFQSAKSKGLIIPKPCEICGEIKSDGHHPDYKKPLKIKWLCRKHHKEQHRIKT